MLTDQMPRQLKRKRNPELKPFIIEKGSYLGIMSIVFLLPVISAILLVLLMIGFQETIPIGLYIGFVILVAILGLLTALATYRKLKDFQLYGSVTNNLTVLLERSLLRFQSLMFPILLLIIVASILIPGTNNSSEAGNGTNYVLLLSFIGIIAPFAGLIPASSLFFDFIDDTNNKIHELSDKILAENLRNELKNIGKELGFKDVKIRLGDLFADSYSNHAWGVVKDGTVLMVYSTITSSKATENQNKIVLTRELYRIKNRKRTRFLAIAYLRNFLYMLSFILVGLLILSVTKPTWNVWIPLINQQDIVNYTAILVIAFLGSVFFKIYLDSYNLLNELRADRDATAFLLDKKFDIYEIKSSIFQVSKLNPLIPETKGLEMRKTSIDALYPSKQHQQKTGITWADI